MKKLIPLLFLLLCILPACKTSEANYRTAYMQAVEQREQSSGIDSTIYARIRNQATMATLAVGADSQPLRTEYVSYTRDGGANAGNTFTYNVVVGQFKQIFNARQMRERLMNNGYPDTRILQTREPLYYVVTASTGSAEEALEAYRRVKSDPGIVLKSPLPFILRPAHLAR